MTNLIVPAALKPPQAAAYIAMSRNVSKRADCNNVGDQLRLRVSPCGSVRDGASGRNGRAQGTRESGVIVCFMRDLYFIRNTLLGYIKIGVTGNITKRLRGLESACGMPLELLRVVPGGCGDESFLLEKFEASRLKGEWFLPNGELLRLATTDVSVSEYVMQCLQREADEAHDVWCREANLAVAETQ